MPSSVRHRLPLRALAAVAAGTAALLGCGLAGSSTADLKGQIAAGKSAAGALQSEIAAETAQIRTTTGGIQDAGRRLAALQIS